MRTMKDSGIKWIGQIPESWGVWRMKHLAQSPLQYGANATGIEFDPDLSRYIRITDITPDRKLSNDGKQSLPETIAKDYFLENGDILFARSGATSGKSFFYDDSYGKCCFAGYLIRFRADGRKANSRFLYYYTLTRAYELWTQEIFIQATIQNISAEKYDNLVFAIPSSLDEQKRIVEYLDSKCSEIDTLIAAKEKTNTLLRERRQSIIYEAVTKGLDSTAPMKDSGVEWIGEVPETWEIASLKRLGTPATGSTPSKDNPSYWDGAIPWVSSKDMKTDYILDSEDHITQEAVNDNGLTLFDPGTLIFCVRSGILRHTFPVTVATVPVTINQDLRALRLNNKINPSFLLYYMRGMNDIIVTLYQKIGATVESIEMDWFLYFPVVLPSIREQNDIVSALDNQCASLDQTIRQNETTISQLKEYRQSLIFEAVTGKIEV